MNANLKSRNRKQLIWPVAGMVLGMIAATNPLHVKPITLLTGIAAWFADALLVLVLSANPIGARVGVLMAGLFMAIPCFVRTAPLNALFLAGFMCGPFLAAAGLLIGQPIVGFRARLARLCAWSDTYPLQRRARRFDAAALRNLFLATAVFAVRRWRPEAGRAWTLTALAITSPMVIEPSLQSTERFWGARDNVLLPTLAAFGFIIILSGIVSLVSLASRSAATGVYAAGQGQAANGSRQTGKN